MATLTIRQVDERIKTKLRVRAAHNGRSMEEEAREILRASLTAPGKTKEDLVSIVRRHFAPLGGVNLKLPKREPTRQPPDFSE